MDTINWGILGAANFAREHMGPAIHEAAGARLAALATSDPEKAVPFAALAPGLTVHDSYDALLADPDIHAVYIPLPNTLHAPWAEKTLRAGKAALVEKPVSMNVAELDRLIAIRDETGQFCAEAFMPPHHPQWDRLRALLAENAVGRLRMVRGIFTYNLGDPGNIRANADLGGGGLRDVGIYPIGMARYALGAEPTGIGARMVVENGVDVLADVRGRFGDVLFTAVSGTALTRCQGMDFHGQDGLIRMQTPFNPGSQGEGRIDLIRQDGSGQSWRYETERQYVLQVEAFGRAMRGGDGFPVPLEFSRGSQAVIDAAFAAA